MQMKPEFDHILKLHSRDLSVSCEKLGLFLCGYMNSPSLYEEKYGPLAPAHGHIPINSADRDAWLSCMKAALDQQEYPEAFKTFLLKRFAIPAERCRNRP